MDAGSGFTAEGHSSQTNMMSSLAQGRDKVVGGQRSPTSNQYSGIAGLSPTSVASTAAPAQSYPGQDVSQGSTKVNNLMSNDQFPSNGASPSSDKNFVDLRRELKEQNVFVFHLPSEWSEEDLKREFLRFGRILSSKVVKRPDGSSKGYGFVCYDNSTSARDAIEQMNGHPANGKRLKVSLKKTPEECLNMQVQKLMELSNGKQPFNREKDCTLFVFHLPSEWDDKELYNRFQEFGTLVSAKVAKKANNSSRGYGFVTYDNPKSAALAIANMNGVEVDQNKRLKVQPKQQTSKQHTAPGCTIFVFHLPNDWTDATLRQHFSHYGKVIGASVQRDDHANSRGYGFVSFDSPQSAINAIAGMNGFSVGHKRLKVSLKKGQESYIDHAAFLQYGMRSPPYALLPSDFGFWDHATAAVAARAAVAAATAQRPGYQVPGAPLDNFSVAAAYRGYPTPQLSAPNQYYMPWSQNVPAPLCAYPGREGGSTAGWRR